MKFRVVVVILLAAIAYGVLYSHLPCWAEVTDKSLYCQASASAEQERARQAAWAKLSPAEKRPKGF